MLYITAWAFLGLLGLVLANHTAKDAEAFWRFGFLPLIVSVVIAGPIALIAALVDYFDS